MYSVYIYSWYLFDDIYGNLFFLLLYFHTGTYLVFTLVVAKVIGVKVISSKVNELDSVQS